MARGMVPSEVAWISGEFVRKPITGVILAFHGLGTTELKKAANFDELEWAAAGGLVVYPYCGPWSWMNRETRVFADDLVTAVFREYRLPADTPLIVCGGSMGGCAALLYSRYSKHRIAACYAFAAVCDVKYSFSERPDVPRTIHCAFRGYPEDLEALFVEHSPLSQVGAMPDIPYLMVHGDKDEAVNKAAHSDKMVAALRGHGRKVEYIEVPGMGHGENVPLGVHLRRIEFVRRFLKGG